VGAEYVAFSLGLLLELGRDGGNGCMEFLSFPVFLICLSCSLLGGRQEGRGKKAHQSCIRGSLKTVKEEAEFLNPRETKKAKDLIQLK